MRPTACLRMMGKLAALRDKELAMSSARIFLRSAIAIVALAALGWWLWPLTAAPNVPAIVIAVEAAHLRVLDRLSVTLPPVKRYEASRSSQSRGQPGQITVINHSGTLIKLSLTAKSCPCAKLDGLPTSLNEGEKATLVMTPSDGMRKSGIVRATIAASANETEGERCFLSVIQELHFIPAVTVSPVIVNLRDLGSNRLGARFNVSFQTNSSEFAERAELRIQNLPIGFETRAERKTGDVAIREGGYEAVWTVTLLSLNAELVPEDVNLMSFAMVSSDDHGAWSAPMQIRLPPKPTGMANGGRAKDQTPQ